MNFNRLTNGDENDSGWRKKVCCNMGIICCNWIAFVLYIVVGSLGVKVRNTDAMANLTIYTQGATDWTTALW